MLTKGLEKTSILWEPIQTAFDWLHSAAHLLKNEAELAGQQVKRRFHRFGRGRETMADQSWGIGASNCPLPESNTKLLVWSVSLL